MQGLELTACQECFLHCTDNFVFPSPPPSGRCNKLYFMWNWQSLQPAGLAHKMASVSSSCCCWQHVTTWYFQIPSTASPLTANFVRDYNTVLCSLATIILVTVSSRKKMKLKKQPIKSYSEISCCLDNQVRRKRPTFRSATHLIRVSHLLQALISHSFCQFPRQSSEIIPLQRVKMWLKLSFSQKCFRTALT